jgi:hypothetical protein
VIFTTKIIIFKSFQFKIIISDIPPKKKVIQQTLQLLICKGPVWDVLALNWHTSFAPAPHHSKEKITLKNFSVFTTISSVKNSQHWKVLLILLSPMMSSKQTMMIVTNLDSSWDACIHRCVVILIRISELVWIINTSQR